MEAVLERLQRLEVKFADENGQEGSWQRPDPDPPYGMPPLWKTPSWAPGGQAGSGPDSRLLSSGPPPHTPATQKFSEPPRLTGGNSQQLGFRANPSPTSTWELGPTRTTWDHPSQRPAPQSQGQDPGRLFKLEPPVFDGSEAHSWVIRVQYYFDHILMPEEHRLHYVVMLFAPAVTDWIFAYRAGNPTVSWRQFLDDVQRRFDPNYFVNYVELLSKLTQTGPLSKYNREFEKTMNHVQDVSEATLLAMYLSGLRHSLRNQVRFQHPSSVASAMALAVEFEVGAERSNPPRRQWQGHDTRGTGASGSAPTAEQQLHLPTPPSSTTACPRDYSKLPVVRLSAAERAEKTKLGLCWYCSEKWAAGHTCKHRFLAYMGPEDDGEEGDEHADSPLETPDVVTADLSHVYSLDGHPRPSALIFQGFLGATEVRVLVDSGSTHNFVHPRVAERSQLPVQPIKPFRVYVGNGQSLVCATKAEKAEVRIQGHAMDIDLHVMKIHGPDVILGVAWLSSLRRVTSDYESGTLEFQDKGRRVCLRVAPCTSRQVSANTFAAIMLHQEAAQCFEIIPVEEGSKGEDSDISFPTELPQAVLDVLSLHKDVFAVPSGLPPSRAFDHICCPTLRR